MIGSNRAWTWAARTYGYNGGKRDRSLEILPTPRPTNTDSRHLELQLRSFRSGGSGEHFRSSSSHEPEAKPNNNSRHTGDFGLEIGIACYQEANTHTTWRLRSSQPREIPCKPFICLLLAWSRDPLLLHLCVVMAVSSRHFHPGSGCVCLYHNQYTHTLKCCHWS